MRRIEGRGREGVRLECPALENEQAEETCAADSPFIIARTPRVEIFSSRTSRFGLENALSSSEWAITEETYATFNIKAPSNT